MTTDLNHNDDAGRLNQPPRWVLPVLGLIGVVLGLLIGGLLSTLRTSSLDDNSAEAGFARDMITHHSQAVDMATLARDRSTDDKLRTLALDMALTQQNQIGQMQAWLNVWSLPQASKDPPMTWMGMPTEGLMPGMATPADVNRLRSLNGREAEILFLNLMIAHHQGGVSMAQAALQRSQQPQVRALAGSIVAGQQNEIKLMTEYLKERGATPAPAATPGMGGMDMGATKQPLHLSLIW